MFSRNLYEKCRTAYLYQSAPLPTPAMEPMILSPLTSSSLSASLLPGRYSVIRLSAPASLRSSMRGATNLQHNPEPPPQTGIGTEQERRSPPSTVLCAGQRTCNTTPNRHPRPGSGRNRNGGRLDRSTASATEDVLSMSRSTLVQPYSRGFVASCLRQHV